MINQYTCRMCGTKFKKKDYPNIEEAFKAMEEHIKTNHGLNIHLSKQKR